MAFLIAAVALVGVICALDLLLTLGVIKRLREHTDLLANLTGAPAIAVGEQVGEFTTTTVNGEPLTNEELAGDDTLVAFLSPTCDPCVAKLPKLLDHAAALPGGRDRVLAVIVGDAESAAPMVADLSPVARVAVEHTDGILSTAFQVKAYPTTLMVTSGEHGRLVVAANHVDLDAPSARV